MAGSTTGWFKATAGPIKGTAVYVSAANMERAGVTPTDMQAQIDAGIGPAIKYVNKHMPAGVAQPAPPADGSAPAAVLVITQANGEQALKHGIQDGHLAVLDTPYGHSIVHVPSGKALLYVGKSGKPTEATQAQALAVLAVLNNSRANWAHPDAETLEQHAQAALQGVLAKHVKQSKIQFQAPPPVDDEATVEHDEPAAPATFGVTNGARVPMTVALGPTFTAEHSGTVQDGLLVYPTAQGTYWQVTHIGSGQLITAATTEAEALTAQRKLAALDVAWTGADNPLVTAPAPQLHAIVAIHKTAARGGYAAAAPQPDALPQPVPPAAPDGATNGAMLTQQVTVPVGKSTQTLDAQVWDGLAVHPAAKGTGWTVTHVGTGYAVVPNLATEHEALVTQAKLHAIGVQWATPAMPLTKESPQIADVQAIYVAAKNGAYAGLTLDEVIGSEASVAAADDEPHRDRPVAMAERLPLSQPLAPSSPDTDDELGKGARPKLVEDEPLKVRPQAQAVDDEAMGTPRTPAAPLAPTGATGGVTITNTGVIHAQHGYLLTGDLTDGLLVTEGTMKNEWDVLHVGSGTILNGGSVPSKADAQGMVNALQQIGHDWTTPDAAWGLTSPEQKIAMDVISDAAHAGHFADGTATKALAPFLVGLQPPQPTTPVGVTNGEWVAKQQFVVHNHDGPATVVGDVRDGLGVWKVASKSWAVTHLGSGKAVVQQLGTKAEAVEVANALQASAVPWTSADETFFKNVPADQKDIVLAVKKAADQGWYKPQKAASPDVQPGGATNGQTLPYAFVSPVSGLTISGDATDGLLVAKSSDGWNVYHVGSGWTVGATVATKHEAQGMVGAYQSLGTAWTTPEMPDIPGGALQVLKDDAKAGAFKKGTAPYVVPDYVHTWMANSKAGVADDEPGKGRPTAQVVAEPLTGPRPTLAVDEPAGGGGVGSATTDALAAGRPTWQPQQQVIVPDPAFPQVKKSMSGDVLGTTLVHHKDGKGGGWMATHMSSGHTLLLQPVATKAEAVHAAEALQHGIDWASVRGNPWADRAVNDQVHTVAKTAHEGGFTPAGMRLHTKPNQQVQYPSGTQVTGDVTNGLMVVTDPGTGVAHVDQVSTGANFGTFATKAEAQAVVDALQQTSIPWNKPTLIWTPIQTDHFHAVMDAAKRHDLSQPHTFHDLPVSVTDYGTGKQHLVLGDLTNSLLVHQDKESDGWIVQHVHSGVKLDTYGTKAEAQTAVDALQTTGVRWNSTAINPYMAITTAQADAVKAHLQAAHQNDDDEEPLKGRRPAQATDEPLKGPRPKLVFDEPTGRRIGAATWQPYDHPAGTMVFSGERWNHWMVHPGHGNTGGWQLLHIPSESDVTNGKIPSKIEAMRLAQALETTGLPWSTMQGQMTDTLSFGQIDQAQTLFNTAYAGGFSDEAQALIPKPNQTVTVPLNPTTTETVVGDVTNGLLVAAVPNWNEHGDGWKVQHIGSGEELGQVYATKQQAQAVVNALHQTGITWNDEDVWATHAEYEHCDAIYAAASNGTVTGDAPHTFHDVAVRMPTPHNAPKVTVQGDITGGLLVHAKDGEWAVTHVHSGMQLDTYATKAQAQTAVNDLQTIGVPWGQMRIEPYAMITNAQHAVVEAKLEAAHAAPPAPTHADSTLDVVALFARDGGNGSVPEDDPLPAWMASATDANDAPTIYGATGGHTIANIVVPVTYPTGQTYDLEGDLTDGLLVSPVGKYGKWGITHVGSGTLVGKALPTKPEAQAVVDQLQQLDERWTTDFSPYTKDGGTAINAVVDAGQHGAFSAGAPRWAPPPIVQAAQKPKQPDEPLKGRPQAEDDVLKGRPQAQAEEPAKGRATAQADEPPGALLLAGAPANSYYTPITGKVTLLNQPAKAVTPLGSLQDVTGDVTDGLVVHPALSGTANQWQVTHMASNEPIGPLMPSKGAAQFLVDSLQTTKVDWTAYDPSATFTDAQAEHVKTITSIAPAMMTPTFVPDVTVAVADGPKSDNTVFMTGDLNNGLLVTPADGGGWRVVDVHTGYTLGNALPNAATAHAVAKALHETGVPFSLPYGQRNISINQATAVADVVEKANAGHFAQPDPSPPGWERWPDADDELKGRPRGAAIDPVLGMPVQAAQEEPNWTATTLASANGEVAGEQWHSWVVHPTQSDPPKWDVIHQPSGSSMTLTPVASADEAKRVAQALKATGIAWADVHAAPHEALDAATLEPAYAVMKTAHAGGFSDKAQTLVTKHDQQVALPYGNTVTGDVTGGLVVYRAAPGQGYTTLADTLQEDVDAAPDAASFLNDPSFLVAHTKTGVIVAGLADVKLSRQSAQALVQAMHQTGVDWNDPALHQEPYQQQHVAKLIQAAKNDALGHSTPHTVHDVTVAVPDYAQNITNTTSTTLVTGDLTDGLLVHKKNNDWVITHVHSGTMLGEYPIKSMAQEAVENLHALKVPWGTTACNPYMTLTTAQAAQVKHTLEGATIAPDGWLGDTNGKIQSNTCVVLSPTKAVNGAVLDGLVYAPVDADEPFRDWAVYHVGSGAAIANAPDQASAYALQQHLHGLKLPWVSPTNPLPTAAPVYHDVVNALESSARNGDLKHGVPVELAAQLEQLAAAPPPAAQVPDEPLKGRPHAQAVEEPLKGRPQAQAEDASGTGPPPTLIEVTGTDGYPVMVPVELANDSGLGIVPSAEIPGAWQVVHLVHGPEQQLVGNGLSVPVATKAEAEAMVAAYQATGLPWNDPTNVAPGTKANSEQYAQLKTIHAKAQAGGFAAVAADGAAPSTYPSTPPVDITQAGQGSWYNPTTGKITMAERSIAIGGNPANSATGDFTYGLLVHADKTGAGWKITHARSGELLTVVPSKAQAQTLVDTLHGTGVDWSAKEVWNADNAASQQAVQQILDTVAPAQTVPPTITGATVAVPVAHTTASEAMQGDLTGGLLLTNTTGSEEIPIYKIYHTGTGEQVGTTFLKKPAAEHAVAGLHGMGVDWTQPNVALSPAQHTQTVQICDASAVGDAPQAVPAAPPIPGPNGATNGQQLTNVAVPVTFPNKATYDLTGDLQDGLLVAQLKNSPKWGIYHVGSGTLVGKALPTQDEAQAVAAQLHRLDEEWTTEIGPHFKDGTPAVAAVLKAGHAGAFSAGMPTWTPPAVVVAAQKPKQDDEPLKGRPAAQAEDEPGKGPRPKLADDELVGKPAAAAVLPPNSYWNPQTNKVTLLNQKVQVHNPAGMPETVLGDVTDGLVVHPSLAQAGTWQLSQVNGSTLNDAIATKAEAQAIANAYHDTGVDWTTPDSSALQMVEHHDALHDVVTDVEQGVFAKPTTLTDVTVAVPTPAGPNASQVLDGDLTNGLLVYQPNAQAHPDIWAVKHIGSGHGVGSIVKSKAEAQAMVDALHDTKIDWNGPSLAPLNYASADQKEQVQKIAAKASIGGYKLSAIPPNGATNGQWITKQPIQVANAEQSTVMADVCDGLAVYPTPNAASGWSVVHVGTGMSVTEKAPSKLAAMEITAQLQATGVTWTNPSDKVVVNSSSDQIKQVKAIADAVDTKQWKYDHHKIVAPVTIDGHTKHAFTNGQWVKNRFVTLPNYDLAVQGDLRDGLMLTPHGEHVWKVQHVGSGELLATAKTQTAAKNIIDELHTWNYDWTAADNPKTHPDVAALIPDVKAASDAGAFNKTKFAQWQKPSAWTGTIAGKPQPEAQPDEPLKGRPQAQPDEPLKGKPVAQAVDEPGKGRPTAQAEDAPVGPVMQQIEVLHPQKLGEKAVISAQVENGLAVHPSLETPGTWAVSQVSTGLPITLPKHATKEAALEVVVALQNTGYPWQNPGNPWHDAIDAQKAQMEAISKAVVSGQPLPTAPAVISTPASSVLQQVALVDPNKVGEKTPVNAYVIGGLAAHTSLNKAGKWEISHVASGTTVSYSVDNKDEAIAVATALQNTGIAWQHDGLPWQTAPDAQKAQMHAINQAVFTKAPLPVVTPPPAPATPPLTLPTPVPNATVSMPNYWSGNKTVTGTFTEGLIVHPADNGTSLYYVSHVGSGHHISVVEDAVQGQKVVDALHATGTVWNDDTDPVASQTASQAVLNVLSSTQNGVYDGDSPEHIHAQVTAGTQATPTPEPVGTGTPAAPALPTTPGTHHDVAVTMPGGKPGSGTTQTVTGDYTHGLIAAPTASGTWKVYHAGSGTTLTTTANQVQAQLVVDALQQTGADWTQATNPGWSSGGGTASTAQFQTYGNVHKVLSQVNYSGIYHGALPVVQQLKPAPAPAGSTPSYLVAPVGNGWGVVENKTGKAASKVYPSAKGATALYNTYYAHHYEPAPPKPTTQQNATVLVGKQKLPMTGDVTGGLLVHHRADDDVWEVRHVGSGNTVGVFTKTKAEAQALVDTLHGTSFDWSGEDYPLHKLSQAELQTYQQATATATPVPIPTYHVAPAGTGWAIFHANGAQTSNWYQTKSGAQKAFKKKYAYHIDVSLDHPTVVGPHGYVIPAPVLPMSVPATPAATPAAAPAPVPVPAAPAKEDLKLTPQTLEMLPGVSEKNPKQTVQADVHGSFAIYKDIGGSGYTLGHTASGYPIAAGFATKADAIKALKTAKASTVDWSYTNKTELKANATNFNAAAALGTTLKAQAAKSNQPRPQGIAAGEWNPPGGVTSFASPQAYDTALKKAYSQGEGFVRGTQLSQASLNAVSSYQNGGYEAINSALWSGTLQPSSSTAKKIADLDKAMSLSSVPFNMTVVRSHGKGTPLYNLMAKVNIDDEYISPAFDSASYNHHLNWGGGGVKVHYRLPKGAKALCLNAISSSPNGKGFSSSIPSEYECLLARNSRWKVVGKTVTATGNIEVTVELVEQTKPTK